MAVPSVKSKNIELVFDVGWAAPGRVRAIALTVKVPAASLTV